MMIPVVILATLLALASSSFVHHPSRHLLKKAGGSAQTKCCLPDNWQSYMVETVLGPGYTEDFLLEYAMKYQENKAAIRFLHMETHAEQSRIVLDFATDTQYNITNGKCIKAPKAVWFEKPLKCMPSDAEFISDYMVGGEKDGWEASYWRASNVTNTLKHIEIGFSKSSCSPITEDVVFDFGIKTRGILSFINFADRIKTPEIFDIPASCNNNVPPPKPKCCLPDNWQSYMTETIIAPGWTEDLLLEYGMKYGENKGAVRLLDRITQEEQSRFVIDFDTGTQYNITNGKCITGPKSVWFDKPVQCMPSNAEFVADYFVGGEVDGWKVSSWKAYNVSEHIKYLDTAMSESCSPVSATAVFDIGVKLRVGINYINFADRIKTPEMFNVPANCMRNPPEK